MENMASLKRINGSFFLTVYFIQASTFCVKVSDGQTVKIHTRCFMRMLY